MRISLLHLFVTYLILLVLACGTFSASAHVDRVSIGDLNTSGSYDSKPLIGPYHYSALDWPRAFPSLLVTLMAFNRERCLAISTIREALVAEGARLRTEHRRLMMDQDAKDSTSRDPESPWSLEISRNLAMQAVLKSREEESIRGWDSKNWVLVGYRMRSGKRYLQWMRLVRDSVTKPSVAESRAVAARND